MNLIVFDTTLESSCSNNSSYILKQSSKLFWFPPLAIYFFHVNFCHLLNQTPFLLPYINPTNVASRQTELIDCTRTLREFRGYRDTKMGVSLLSSPAFPGVFLFSLVTLCLIPELAVAGITRHYKFDVCLHAQLYT